MTEFFLPMIPPTATHQEQGSTVRNGKHVRYARGNGDAEAKLTAHLAQHIPPEPYTGALRVVMKWCYPIRGKHRDGEWYTNKPDADNICKAPYDIMTRLGYWRDDKQIASSITEQFWAAVPGIYVRIEELT